MDLYFRRWPARWRPGSHCMRPEKTPTIWRSIQKPRSCRTTAQTFTASIHSAWCRRCGPTTASFSPKTPRSCNTSPIAFRKLGIAAGPGVARSRLHQWLCFIGTELHKGLFAPMLDKKAPAEMKSYLLGKGLSRLDFLDNYLKGREFLLDHFSVADAYLVTVINWTMATPPIELSKWAAVKAYYERLTHTPKHRKGGRRGIRAVQSRTRPPSSGGITYFLCPSPLRPQGGGE